MSADPKDAKQFDALLEENRRFDPPGDFTATGPGVGRRGLRPGRKRPRGVLGRIRRRAVLGRTLAQGA